jgi:hypothetical protein
MGEKGDTGPAGPPGPKGDMGEPGSSGIRVLAPVGLGQTSSCEADEVMIGAWCTGTSSSYPLRASANEASCATDTDAGAQVVVVCAKK